MLANSGLKYAYAQSKGRWVNMGDHKVYIEGDLDRSRKKVCFICLDDNKSTICSFENCYIITGLSFRDYTNLSIEITLNK